MFNVVGNFLNDENGAVTVDWVVLTAAIVGLGVVVDGHGDHRIAKVCTSESRSRK